ncbi:MAG: flagella basal body P-ring formation protein FlgA [Polyangiaceae bacterium]|jgi:hypothetical protein
MMKRLVLSLALLAGSARSAAATPLREVPITGLRVHVGDVVPDADPTAAAVDIGPSPTAGASRVVHREEILAALNAKQVAAPSHVPEAVRVTRRAKHLQPTELDAIVRGAVAAKSLGRGVSLSAVRVERTVDVADGWSRVEVEVPRAPKRLGPFSTTALASFLTASGEVTGRIAVPVELTVAPEGASYDAIRGSQVTIVVRRGAVEVRAAGVTLADADVGDLVPVQIRPSGRVLRARLTANDEALALEDGQ